MATTIKRGFGAIASPIDVRDYKAACISGATFPDEFELYRPQVKDQGAVNSCVAHALSSLVEYFNYIQEKTYIKMSTAYIYGNRYGSTFTGEGMIVSQALANLRRFGDCPDAQFTGNYEVPLAITKFKETASQIPGSQSYANRITSYFTLSTDSAIKANLMENGIVIIATTWYNDTKCVGGVLQFNPESGSVGRHCMFIYGWNKQGWLVGNSWGRNWGAGGNCIIPFGTKLSEVWGVIDTVMSESQKDQYIEELKAKINEIQAKCDDNQQSLDDSLKTILEQTVRIDELTRQITDTTLTNEQLSNSINQIKEQLKSTQEQLKKAFAESAEYKKIKEAYETELMNCKAEIERLNSELLEYKKPFHSQFGQFVAKILNFFANLFKKKET